jgi:hypothetical protein
LALVVDQLEELFTTGFSPELQQKYISALAGLVRSSRVFVLVTLRSDFYPRYQEFPDLIELAKGSGKFDLRPPTPYEIGNMIRLPAEAAGLHFEQERETGQRLDQALRDAASATPESLPLLEYVLSLLYDKQGSRGDNLLRWSDYRELGELKGALAKHAEAVFSTLQPHAFKSAAQAFKSEAQVAAKLQQQLRQASWASFNQAERQFQSGEWREGIALLARAIKFDPENRVASERFFQELIVHREKALPPLIASFAHQDAVEYAAFSPDGARILTACPMGGV